jgi:hypothetical protein
LNVVPIAEPSAEDVTALFNSTLIVSSPNLQDEDRRCLAAPTQGKPHAVVQTRPRCAD